MKSASRRTENVSRESTRVPPGAPRWVTPDLIAATIRTWQPYYKKPLTKDDALAMILNVARLLDAVQEST